MAQSSLEWLPCLLRAVRHPLVAYHCVRSSKKAPITLALYEAHKVATSAGQITAAAAAAEKKLGVMWLGGR